MWGSIQGCRKGGTKAALNSLAAPICDMLRDSDRE